MITILDTTKYENPSALLISGAIRAHNPDIVILPKGFAINSMYSLSDEEEMKTALSGRMVIVDRRNTERQVVYL